MESSPGRTRKRSPSPDESYRPAARKPAARSSKRTRGPTIEILDSPEPAERPADIGPGQLLAVVGDLRTQFEALRAQMRASTTQLINLARAAPLVTRDELHAIRDSISVLRDSIRQPGGAGGGPPPSIANQTISAPPQPPPLPPSAPSTPASVRTFPAETARLRKQIEALEEEARARDEKDASTQAAHAAVVEDLQQKLLLPSIRYHEIAHRHIPDGAILEAFEELKLDIHDLVIQSLTHPASWARHTKDLKEMMKSISPFYDQVESWNPGNKVLANQWRVACLTAVIWRVVVENVFEDEAGAWCSNVGAHFWAICFHIFQNIETMSYNNIHESNQARLRFLPWVLDHRLSESDADRRLLPVAKAATSDLTRAIPTDLRQPVGGFESQVPFTMALLRILRAALRLHDRLSQSAAIWRVDFPRPRGSHRVFTERMMRPYDIQPPMVERPEDGWVMAVVAPSLRRWGDCDGQFSEPVECVVVSKATAFMLPFSDEVAIKDEDKAGGEGGGGGRSGGER